MTSRSWRDSTMAFYTREGWGDYGTWFVKTLTGDVDAGGRPIDDN